MPPCRNLPDPLEVGIPEGLYEIAMQKLGRDRMEGPTESHGALRQGKGGGVT